MTESAEPDSGASPDAQALAAQIKAAFASLDLKEVGLQMMARIAEGIAAGSPEASS
ncbi:MAG: hypothetical protein AB7S70_02605 [Hyphomicrobium sp.]|uniref:hypothetical protein n=1 Tax=Hyphomicrobium sp. TaxID=82 RepID=UPI003D0AFBFC